jgi:hypothetical protein
VESERARMSTVQRLHYDSATGAGVFGAQSCHALARHSAYDSPTPVEHNQPKLLHSPDHHVRIRRYVSQARFSMSFA